MCTYANLIHYGPRLGRRWVAERKRVAAGQIVTNCGADNLRGAFGHPLQWHRLADSVARQLANLWKRGSGGLAAMVGGRFVGGPRIGHTHQLERRFLGSAAIRRWRAYALPQE